ncbi:MAG TPA: ABC transporter permease [Acidimicrobiia bacterium]
MWKATIRGILARKVRLALTALAVMLGVAFVSATYVLTDTMRSSFDFVFAETLAGVDVVVSAPAADSDVGVLGGGLLGTPKHDRLPDDVIAAVRELDGVAAADGLVGGYAQFVDQDGEAIQNGFAPTLGLTWTPLDGSGPFRPVGGNSRAPEREGEVAMDAGTARKHGFEVGDTVDVLLQGPVEEFEIVGLFGLGDTTEFGGLTFAAFDLATSQRVLAADDAVDLVAITAEPGVSAAELQARLQSSLGPGYAVDDAATVAYESGSTVRQFVGLFNGALLAFAAVGLVVGAFIIVNTFTILVAQRTRELGLLRTMGASGRQVLGSVVMEAGAVGVLASVLGLAIGVALAGAMLGLVARFGFDVPDTGTVVLARTVVVAIAVGLLVTVGAALFPAVRAARTPPMVAIHDTVRTSVAPLRRRAVVGGAVLVVGLAVLLVGLAVDPPGIYERLFVVGAGALGAFLGAILLVATFARPLARLLGWPVARTLSAPGVLARRNAMRNPRRTAATASALVVGLSLVCLVAIFSASTKASLRDAVDSGIRADLVLTTKQLVGFSPEVVEVVRELPAVQAATGVRLRQIYVDGNLEYVVGVDADTIDDVVDLGVVDGSTAGLESGGVLLHEGEAGDYGVGVGDQIAIQLPSSVVMGFPVAGVYEQQNFIGGFPVPTFVISQEQFDASVGAGQQDSLVFVKARPGEVGEAQREIEAALSEEGQEFPNVRVQTRAEFRAEQEDAVDRFVAVLVALLALSEIIAVLGIINTLFLSVYERTRELGLLRAVGMARRQVRTMIRGESVIIATIGGVVGIVVGVFWGWAFTAALERQGITAFSIPIWQLVVFLVLSVVAGIVAALLPAWRAGRLDVLEAIATE